MAIWCNGGAGPTAGGRNRARPGGRSGAARSASRTGRSVLTFAFILCATATLADAKWQMTPQTSADLAFAERVLIAATTDPNSQIITFWRDKADQSFAEKPLQVRTFRCVDVLSAEQASYCEVAYQND